MLAEQPGATVEVVQRSDRLLQLGGVGALLRYRKPQLSAGVSALAPTKLAA